MEYPVKVTAAKEQLEFKREEYAKKIGSERLLSIYRNMVRTMEFDNTIEDLLLKGHDIVQHNTRGQEATPIVAASFLGEEDYLMPYHRGWAWAIGKGMEPKKMLAELLNRTNGYNMGRAGAQLGDYDLKVMGRPGIQAAHIPIATGIGFTCKLNKASQVCLCLNGNGSSNAGNFYEALNIAGTFKLPVLYIVENNLYEIFEPIKDTTPIEDIALRSIGSGMPGYIVDGNDVIMLYYILNDVYDYVRSGNGPVLVEAKTYRHEGHGNSDTLSYGGYRSKEEVDEWIKKDPIPRLKKDLLELNMATEADFEKIHKEALDEMMEAIEYALAGVYPTKEELLMYNYVD
ncbi:MAG: thiamine pyrophosphate-dependent dehydrogenase E1 component subunit alpha [Tissierellia bacterium]|nr:thiamine pyrophosphate-dependent dehydrogenase E1 component subunit alpha [Tissierellia bacterium]